MDRKSTKEIFYGRSTINDDKGTRTGSSTGASIYVTVNVAELATLIAEELLSRNIQLSKAAGKSDEKIAPKTPVKRLLRSTSTHKKEPSLNSWQNCRADDGKSVIDELRLMRSPSTKESLNLLQNCPAHGKSVIDKGMQTPSTTGPDHDSTKVKISLSRISVSSDRLPETRNDGRIYSNLWKQTESRATYYTFERFDY